MSLENLQKKLESDPLIQSRIININIDGNTLSVTEHGNPALEVDDDNPPPEIVETGEPHVSNHVQDLANDILGHNKYKCESYEDTETSEITITV